MPQVDLETLVSAIAGASSDRKITCETLADADEGSSSGKEEDGDHHAHAAVHDVPPDFPPESFWLSKDAEVDWFDRNAFFERKESTKGYTNSGNLNPHSNSNSQRFPVNLKSKASLFGLPKTQKANYVDAKRRANKPANVKFFPRRSASAGKNVVSDVEPTSPKVSCMGRVRSKRCRRRLTSEGSQKREKIAHKSGSKEEKRKKGFYSKVLSIFKSGRSDQKKPAHREEIESLYEEEKPRKSSVYITRQMPDVPLGSESESEAPGLGGMRKLASGRRSMEGFDDADAPGLGGMRKLASGRRSTEGFDDADAPGLGGMRKLASGRRSTEWLEEAEAAPGLGGMKKLSSGRRSTEEFDGALAEFLATGSTRRN